MDEEFTTLPDNPAVLTIRNALPFAHIVVDGFVIGDGSGEFEAELAAGEHTIQVCQRSYHCAVDTVQLERGEQRTWDAPERLEEVRTSPVWGIVTAVVALGTISAGVALFNRSDEQRSDGQAVAGFGIVGLGLGLGVVSIAILVEPGPERPAEADFDVLSERLPSAVGSVRSLVFELSF